MRRKKNEMERLLLESLYRVQALLNTRSFPLAFPPWKEAYGIKLSVDHTGLNSLMDLRASDAQ